MIKYDCIFFNSFLDSLKIPYLIDSEINQTSLKVLVELDPSLVNIYFSIYTKWYLPATNHIKFRLKNSKSKICIGVKGLVCENSPSQTLWSFDFSEAARICHYPEGNHCILWSNEKERGGKVAALKNGISSKNLSST